MRAMTTMRLLAREGTSGVDDAFLELSERIYANDPRSIPEDAGAVRRAFSAANAWHDRGRAVTFCVPGRARLAAFRHPHCRVDGREAAFFGYWEHRDAADHSATAVLLDEAAAWAASHGAEMLYGPVDFTTFGRYRVLAHAEPDALPFPGEPYNPPWYPSVLEASGLVPVQEYVTQVGVIRPDGVAAKRAAHAAVLGAGFTMETLDGERWLALLPELHRVADAIFGAGLAYTSIPLDQFRTALGEGVARRLCPRTSIVARAPDGTLAGFVLAVPHYGPMVVRGAHGGAVAPDALSFAEHVPMLERAGHRTAIAKTVGVAPAYRSRGVMDAMGVEVLQRGREHYDRWLAALIRVDNHSRRFGRVHADAERRYTLYARAVRGGAA